MCYFSAKFGHFLIWLPGGGVFGYFRNIGGKIWRIFVRDLEQGLVHKKV